MKKVGTNRLCQRKGEATVAGKNSTSGKKPRAQPDFDRMDGRGNTNRAETEIESHPGQGDSPLECTE